MVIALDKSGGFGRRAEEFENLSKDSQKNKHSKNFFEPKLDKLGASLEFQFANRHE